MENRNNLLDSRDIEVINSLLGKPCWVVETIINTKSKYLSFRIESCIVTDISFNFDFDEDSNTMGDKLNILAYGYFREDNQWMAFPESIPVKDIFANLDEAVQALQERINIDSNIIKNIEESYLNNKLV